MPQQLVMVDGVGSDSDDDIEVVEGYAVDDSPREDLDLGPGRHDFQETHFPSWVKYPNQFQIGRDATGHKYVRDFKHDLANLHGCAYNELTLEQIVTGAIEHANNTDRPCFSFNTKTKRVWFHNTVAPDAWQDIETQPRRAKHNDIFFKVQLVE